MRKSAGYILQDAIVHLDSILDPRCLRQDFKVTGKPTEFVIEVDPRETVCPNLTACIVTSVERMEDFFHPKPAGRIW